MLTTAFTVLSAIVKTAFLASFVVFSWTSTAIEAAPELPEDGVIETQLTVDDVLHGTLLVKLIVKFCRLQSMETSDDGRSISLISGITFSLFSRHPDKNERTIIVAKKNFTFFIGSVLLVVFNYVDYFKLFSRGIPCVGIYLMAFFVIDKHLRNINHIQTPVKISVYVI